MRINLIYEELRILITTYKSISVDELCQNVKIFMNDKDSDYIIINEDNVPLQSDEIINAEDKEEHTFFVLKRVGIPEPQERESEKKIEDLIREVKATKNVTTYKTATGEEKVKYDSELGTKIDAIIPEMWAYLLSFGSDIDAAVYNYDDVISVLFPEFDGEVGEMNWHIIMA